MVMLDERGDRMMRDTHTVERTARDLLDDQFGIFDTYSASTRLDDAQRTLDELHRAHDATWPARICGTCRPIADALALFDDPLDVLMEVEP